MFCSAVSYVLQCSCTSSAALIHMFCSAVAHAPQCSCTCSAVQLHMFGSAVAHALQCSCTCSAVQLHLFCTAVADVPHCSCTSSAVQLHLFRSAVALVPQCSCTFSAVQLHMLCSSVAHALQCSCTCSGLLLRPRVGNLAVVPPKSKTSSAANQTLFDSSFAVQGPILWNAMPHHLNTIPDLEQFKSKLTQFLLSIPDKPPIRGWNPPNRNTLLCWKNERGFTSLWGGQRI